MPPRRVPISRRHLMAGALVAAVGGAAAVKLRDARPYGSRQATGVKLGEVTANSAIVWMRLTRHSRPTSPSLLPTAQAEPIGTCPGAEGRVRLRYGLEAEPAGVTVTEWTNVDAHTDYTKKFTLSGLRPNSRYWYSAETADSDGNLHAPLHGDFATAATGDQYADVTFTAITCTYFRHLDQSSGFRIFDSMLKLRPDFYVHTGDNVYYDTDDLPATSVELARHHWHRMHSLRNEVAFHLATPGYWEKDDHDTHQDNCWSTLAPEAVAPFTFSEGQATFREQTPTGASQFRTFRWGKGLQIWLTEGRDFRSPNTAPDGPEKTLWGVAQKEWLKRTLLASDADFKILLSPTPIVGPDRAHENDNHATAGFATEGTEIRSWIRDRLSGRLVVICGDRHWQYHSRHPETGLHELCTGPASDLHAGNPAQYDPAIHRFYRVKGGFVSASFRRIDGISRLVLRHHDVDGAVLHEHRVDA